MPRHLIARRPLRSAAFTAAIAAATVLPVLATGTPARAGSPAQLRPVQSTYQLPGALPVDRLGDAKDRATRLRKELAALQVRAEQATEAYDAAEARLGAAVTQHILAQRQLEDAQAAMAGASAEAGATIRAIYRAGGTTALYATVLEGSDPSDVLSRLHAVESIVGSDHAMVTASQDVTARATAIAAHLHVLAARQTRLELAVAARADQVRASVSQQQALLAAADADVRRIAAEQAAAIDAAAAHDAAAALDAARANAVPGGPGDVPAPDPTVVTNAIAAAKAELGKPYQWGATGPGTFDCSGLTGWAYRQAGISLPRTSREQWYAGPHPGLGYLQPGDLLFWATDPTNPATIHHVALYLGDDQMIAAPHTGTVVQIQPVYLTGYIGAVRPSAARPVSTPASTSATPFGHPESPMP